MVDSDEKNAFEKISSGDIYIVSAVSDTGALSLGLQLLVQLLRELLVLLQEGLDCWAFLVRYCSRCHL